MITNLKNLTLGKLLLLAIILRLILMPFFFHPDIKTYHFQSSFLKQGVWNIYTYLDDNAEFLPFKEEFVYFPLTYFFLGGYQLIIGPLLGSNFSSWLHNASSEATEVIGIFRYLLLLKLPYLFLDIAIALLLLRFVTEERNKKVAFTLWLFNPFSIIIIYIFSNVDIISVFLTILSLLLAHKSKLILAALCIGLAAGFKAYPLLFLPFLLIYGKSFRNIFFMLLASLGTLSLIILPFYSQSFQKAALISGLTTRIVTSGLSINFGESLFPFIVSYSALLCFQIINSTRTGTKELLKYYLAVLLLLFSLVHYHIQWLLWVIPFIILLSLRADKLMKFGLILIVIAFIIPLLYNDKFMSVSLLRTYSSFYSLLPTPFNITQRIYDSYTIQSVLHSILAGGSLILIWQLFKGEKV